MGSWSHLEGFLNPPLSALGTASQLGNPSPIPTQPLHFLCFTQQVVDQNAGYVSPECGSAQPLPRARLAKYFKVYPGSLDAGRCCQQCAEAAARLVGVFYSCLGRRKGGRQSATGQSTGLVHCQLRLQPGQCPRAFIKEGY